MTSDAHDDPPRSIAEVAEVRRFAARGGEGDPPDVLIEVPHGATAGAEFEATRRRLRGDYPPELVEFFHVNTDVGAPEVAWAVAERLAGAEGGSSSATVLRSLVPRTFIDCNRVLDAQGGKALLRESRLTPGLPEYVTHPDDVALLAGRHAAYTREAERAYQEVCAAGGLALILHTYAPRSVEIHDVDAGIVRALRAAYAPERYARWVERPAVDLITQGADGALLAPDSLVRRVREALQATGLEVTESASYRLHPQTAGWRHATRWPGCVLCVELRRDLLVPAFRPFEPMSVAPDQVERFARALAAAFTSELAARRAIGEA